MFESASYAKQLNLKELKKYFKDNQPTQTELNDSLFACFSNSYPDEERTPIIEFLISLGANINYAHSKVVEAMFSQNNIRNFEDTFKSIKLESILTHFPILINRKYEDFQEAVLLKIETNFCEEFKKFNLKSLFNFTESQKEAIELLEKTQFRLRLKDELQADRIIQAKAKLKI